MAAAETCPSCRRPVTPADFQCPNCELILHSELHTPALGGDISIVRRMLEAPQAGIPLARPSAFPPTPPPMGLADLESTSVMTLEPALDGVPVVVATMSRKQRLNELEAFVLSLIDGFAKTEELARRAELSMVEVRIVLSGLRKQSLVEFSDLPVSNQDLELPFVLGTLVEETPKAAAQALPPPPPPPSAPPPIAPVGIGEAKRTPAHGASISGNTGAFVPSSRGSGLTPVHGAQRSSPSGLTPGPGAPRTSPSGLTPAHGVSTKAPPRPPASAPSGLTPAHVPASSGSGVTRNPSGSAPAHVPASSGSGVTRAPSSPASGVAPTHVPASSGSGLTRPPGSSPSGLTRPPEPEAPRIPPPMLAPSTGQAKHVSRRDLDAPTIRHASRPASETPAPPRAATTTSRPTPAPSPPHSSSVSPPPSTRLAEPTENADSRIAMSQPANRLVLEALRQVKRPGQSSAPSPQAKASLAEVLARDTLQVALRMEQAGRPQDAIRFLEKSIAQSPDAASLYNRLGIILVREKGDYSRAEKLIKKAVELVPENPVYEANLKRVKAHQTPK